MFIEDFENSIRWNLYGKKCKELNVSREVLFGRRYDDGIHLEKIISQSFDYDQFVNNVSHELIRSKNTDYLHFSLIMGLYFDCFHLYNFMYISPEVLKDVVPTISGGIDTMRFLKNHEYEIFSYLEEKYGISYEKYTYLINKLFDVSEYDQSFYNSNIVRDIGMILMGNSLGKHFYSCQDAIDLFNKRNSKSIGEKRR